MPMIGGGLDPTYRDAVNKKQMDDLQKQLDVEAFQKQAMQPPAPVAPMPMDPGMPEDQTLAAPYKPPVKLAEMPVQQAPQAQPDYRPEDLPPPPPASTAGADRALISGMLRSSAMVGNVGGKAADTSGLDETERAMNAAEKQQGDLRQQFYANLVKKAEMKRQGQSQDLDLTGKRLNIQEQQAMQPLKMMKVQSELARSKQDLDADAVASDPTSAISKMSQVAIKRIMPGLKDEEISRMSASQINRTLERVAPALKLQYEQDKDKQEYDFKMRELAQKQSEKGAFNEKTFGAAKGIGDTWRPERKTYDDSMQFVQNLHGGLDLNSPLGDDMALTMVQKLQDPGSVVKESEFVRSKDGQGAYQSLIMNYNKNVKPLFDSKYDQLKRQGLSDEEARKQASQSSLTPSFRSQLRDFANKAESYMVSRAQKNYDIAANTIRNKIGEDPEIFLGERPTPIRSSKAVKPGSASMVNDEQVPAASGADPFEDEIKARSQSQAPAGIFTPPPQQNPSLPKDPFLVDAARRGRKN